MSKCIGTKTYNVYSKVIIRVQANKKKKARIHHDHATTLVPKPRPRTKPAWATWIF